MIKTTTFLIALNICAISSFSQTVKQKIEKENNAANKANAAKADVIVQKKIISDSSQIQKKNSSHTLVVKHVMHKKRKNKVLKRKKHLARK